MGFALERLGRIYYTLTLNVSPGMGWTPQLAMRYWHRLNGTSVVGSWRPRQEAVCSLEALERRPHAQRPAHWTDKGSAERTVVTRFGEVHIRRRLYQDTTGDYR